MGVDVRTRPVGAKKMAAKRAIGFAQRAARLQKLRREGKHMRRGAIKVAKQGLKPCATYGHRCLGMPDTKLQQVRRQIAKAITWKRCDGTSLTLRLAMLGQEVGHEINAAPVVQWAAVVWEHRVPEDQLQRAWKRQMQEVGLKPSWSKVRGPAGATIMSLRRAGWKWPAWNLMLSRAGLKVQLQEMCPKDVEATIRQDFLDEQWVEWIAQPKFAPLAPRPFIEPLCQTLREKRASEGGKAKNIVRSIVVSGATTQQVLFNRELQEHYACRACLRAVGPPHHRYYICPAFEEQRRRSGSGRR